MTDFLATLTKPELDDLRCVCAPEHWQIVSNEIGRRNDEELMAHRERERNRRCHTEKTVNALNAEVKTEGMESTPAHGMIFAIKPPVIQDITV